MLSQIGKKRTKGKQTEKGKNTEEADRGIQGYTKAKDRK